MTDSTNSSDAKTISRALIYLLLLIVLTGLFFSAVVIKNSSITKAADSSQPAMMSTKNCDDPNNPPAEGDKYCLGQWSPTYNAPVPAVHSFVLPDGKLLIFPVNGNITTETDAYVFDPPPINSSTDPTYTSVTFGPTTHGNLFCAGHDFLQDGRLLLTGGHLLNNKGIEETTLFDFRKVQSNPWSRPPNSVMSDGRWYPSNCTLGKGEQLIMMGNPSNGGYSVLNMNLEIWRNRNKISSSIGTFPSDAAINYPFSFLNNQGLVFIAGALDNTFFINPKNGSSTAGSSSSVPKRDYGSAVMYDQGKILITGGGFDPYYPYNSAETIDINDCSSSSCGWTTVAPMKKPRRQHNSTVLPDGKVLVTGGSSGSGHSVAAAAENNAEMWNPDGSSGGSWRLLAETADNRLYHSTAVLLPDARVLVGGGEWAFSTSGECNTEVCENGCTTAVDGKYYCNRPVKTLEIFSPPYLFNEDGTAAARPQIISAPQNVGYNKTFSIETSNLSGDINVSWVRLSAVTHSFNQGQRIYKFDSPQPITDGNNNTVGLSLKTPANGNYSPPGYYMLFVLQNGVPSEAKIIQITDKEASHKFDFDEDRKTDWSIWRPSTGEYKVKQSTGGYAGFTATPSPTPNNSVDKPVPGDYDGDGVTDYAIRRTLTSGATKWIISDSSDGAFSETTFGVSTDIAVPADYDGDRLTDVAVYQPGNNTWYLSMSQTGYTYVTFGTTGAIPVPGYYDDDSIADLAYWDPSNGNWYILQSTNSQTVTVQFGQSGDYVVPNDYDGDTKTDIAVWRPSNGIWYVIESSTGVYNPNNAFQYGASTDIPVAADYDADGKADKAVWRPSNGYWFFYESATGTHGYTQYGASTDIPIPSLYYRQ